MISKKNAFFTVFLTLLSLLITYPHSLFSGGFAGVEQRISLDAKMMSLGGSYDAISDNVESIYFNPAGLVFIEKISMLCSYMPVWDNLTRIYFIGSAFKTRYVPVGVGILNISTEGIPVRSSSPEVSRTIDYADLSFYVSTAYTIWPGLSAGLRINLLYKDILGYNDVGIGTDLAFLWRVDRPYTYTKSKLMKAIKPISFGLVLNNLIPPSITLKEDRETYPLEIKNSISYRFQKQFNLLEPELGIGLDMVPQFDSYLVNIGLDLKLWDLLFVRTGYRFMDNVFTIGTGVKMRTVIFDYGMSGLATERTFYTLNLKAYF